MWECKVISEFKDGRKSQPFPIRKPGDTVTIEDADRLIRWRDRGLIELDGPDIPKSWPWGIYEGRYLTALKEEPYDWNEVIGILNIWQDLEDLKETIDTWYPHVDWCLAIDGAYAKVPADKPWSTDGTVEYLRSKDKVKLVETNEFWENQRVKRSEFFRRTKEDDLLLELSADTYIDGAENLRNLPFLDVGWTYYENPIYDRPQDFPAVFRGGDVHYAGRHHWLWEDDCTLLTTFQIGGRDVVHRNVPIQVNNRRGINRDKERQEATKVHRQKQHKEENQVGPNVQGGREVLRIVQVCPYDPGGVAYRLHTAINAATPHESIMAATRTERSQQTPHQYHVKDDKQILRNAVEEADIVHCHVRYREFDSLNIEHDGPLVIHHHGSKLRKNTKKHRRLAADRADLRIVSNLELLSYDDNLFYLPNPVLAKSYKRLADEVGPDWDERPFTVTHSPTKRKYKGTDEFLQAIDELQKEGLDVETRLVEGQTTRESIHAKAESHACFDSFWLGMQVSGLEAAACGTPVIAGDEEVRERYLDWLKYTPYSYADDKERLKYQIRELATNREYYEQEAERVRSYTVQYHDLAATAHRYLHLLNAATGWARRMYLNRFRGSLSDSHAKHPTRDIDLGKGNN